VLFTINRSGLRFKLKREVYEETRLRVQISAGGTRSGDKDAITLLFAAVLNKGSMKVKLKRKKINKAGLSGISIEESFAFREILLVCQERSCEENAQNSGLNASIRDASVIELCRLLPVV
jgi:hypothetical protein